MRLSKRGEYGLRAMIMLAGTPHENAPLPVVQIKEISEREKISPKFLEQILLTLKNAGLLHSKMGVGGGYYLARPPSEITLGQIFRVLDGPVAPSNASARWRMNHAAVPMRRPAACGW